jgi:hypothetical protein
LAASIQAGGIDGKNIVQWAFNIWRDITGRFGIIFETTDPEKCFIFI